MAGIKREVIVDCRQDSIGEFVAISHAADDPLRHEIANAVGAVLDKHGRVQEADRVLNSVTLGVHKTSAPYDTESA